MPDIKAIVQRMIDAGESEENIATVIRSQPEARSRPLIPASVAGSHPEARIGADPHPGGSDFKIFGIPIHIPGPDKPRLDENIATIGGVGIPPEAVLMGPVQAGRAMVAPGLSMAGRAAAGASSIVSSAAPVVKYEIAKHTLQAVGLPESVAAVAAMGISGYRKGGAAAAAGTAAKDAAIAEAAPATRATTPFHELPLYQQMEQMPATAAPASAPMAAPAVQQATAQSVPAVTQAAVQAAPVAGKVLPFNPSTALKAVKDTFAKLGEIPRPAEASNAMELVRIGKTPDEAVQLIVSRRPPMSAAEELAKRLGTPTDAERIAAQDARWQQGKVKTPSAETARARRGGS